MRKRSFLLIWTALLTVTLPVLAQLEVPALFSDNMVLQQEQPIAVWGLAKDGDTVTVSFRGQKVKAKAKDNKWSVKLKAAKPGAPDKLTIATEGQQLVFTNVLVGDVWICSGQSNMEWPLSSAFESQGDINSATNPMIRLFHVQKARSDTPVTNVKATWKFCSPANVPSFTAVGYYFGRDLQQARQVPIGLIQSDWGGTPAEAWMSHAALEANPRYRAEILDAYEPALANYKTALAAYEKDKADAKATGKEFKKGAPWAPWRPSELYNGMIAPLVPYSFKGAIWYQGESNAGRAEQYRTLFPDMIRGWRKDWGRDFPFFCVQLAPFMAVKEQPSDSAWAELREAQLIATKVLPGVGMAVITDVGDPKDIHPKKKQPVGARLALAARGIAYGEKIEYSGPLYDKVELKDGKAVLHFTHIGKGLEARDGELKGFAICGEDKQFVWAKAAIVGNTVEVSSETVAKPVAVRYGWADCPVVNLWNKDGLPASPFRTDDFPMITASKK